MSVTKHLAELTFFMNTKSKGSGHIWFKGTGRKQRLRTSQ